MRVRNPTEIGALIRDQRKRLGLDQRELAARVGVSRQWVIEVEHGKQRAELGLILKTLQALGVRLDVTADDVSAENYGTEAPDLDAIIHDARKPRP